MNPIIELGLWGRKDQDKIEKVMRTAGYEILIDGSLTTVWALKKFVPDAKGEKDE